MEKINVGITGQSGFIGTHLYNYLGLKNQLNRISFIDDYFQNSNSLDNFVKQCNIIVHLAALNRHNDPEKIYNTNVRLVSDLIASCNRTHSKAHIIYASSIQENFANPYGKSKKICREMFERWAEIYGNKFTGMIIPNVFGPFGNPYYNSVISTFCYQLTHGEKPEIHIDNELKLIYINELVEEFYKIIINKIEVKQNRIMKYDVPYSSEKRVSEILEILSEFNEIYYNHGIIPQFNNNFELALFNTYRCYMPEKKYPFLLKKNIDARGVFIEIIRTNTSGQFSFSTTKPGITRGNHFHTRKIERFSVIKGKAKIALRRLGTEEIIEYTLDGAQPSYVDIPIWHSHNITNIGKEELFTLFWINEPYDPDDADTYFENVFER